MVVARRNASAASSTTNVFKTETGKPLPNLFLPNLSLQDLTNIASKFTGTPKKRQCTSARSDPTARNTTPSPALSMTITTTRSKESSDAVGRIFVFSIKYYITIYPGLGAAEDFEHPDIGSVVKSWLDSQIEDIGGIENVQAGLDFLENIESNAICLIKACSHFWQLIKANL